MLKRFQQTAKFPTFIKYFQTFSLTWNKDTLCIVMGCLMKRNSFVSAKLFICTRGNSDRTRVMGKSLEKLTQAWKLTFKISSHFRVRKTQCMAKGKFLCTSLPYPKQDENFFLTLFLIFPCRGRRHEHFHGEREKVFIWLFNLCFTRNFYYSSHMHGELCLCFTKIFYRTQIIRYAMPSQTRCTNGCGLMGNALLRIYFLS